MLGDDPPYLSVGTEVSAKYKGAFCEAKIRKVVRSVKCRVTYKQALGTATVTDDQIKGTLRVGATVEARHIEKKEFVEATITKIQDCSQYTVVFDDGDITTLRRTALCLKSGRHFAESETLDQLPLTHPEHFGNPVIGGRRGRRSRQTQEDSSDDDDDAPRGSNDSGSTCGGKDGPETEPEIGRVVCVELGDKKKKDNWFPGLVVAPTAQDTVRIRVRDDYLVRSFKDARYYTVPKKEATEFTKDLVTKVENSALKVAVEKALLFLEKNELPPHWDRDVLFGNGLSSGNSDSDADLDSDSSDDEPREEKDHFVAQLYKFMDDRGTPINNCPMIGNEDIDLYRLFRAVYKLGGYNRVTNQNQWKIITRRLNFTMQNTASTHNLVKQAYKKFLHSFEDFYRKLGCTMVNHPRGGIRKPRPGRSLIRDKDRNTPVPTQDKTIKLEKDDDEKEKKIADDEIKKEKREIKKEPVVKEEEIQTKVKRKEEPIEESASGQESDVNIDAAEESSSSEKSQKSIARLTPSSSASNKSKAGAAKIKEEPAKKKTVAERKKPEAKKQDKKDEKIKEEDNTKTRSKVKDDVVKSAKANTETRETRAPSRESDKKTFIKQRRMTDDELKKRGRKKKEVESDTKGRVPPDDKNVEYASSYKGPIELHDRLKVYYGPNHESKVTYEAKVIDIETEKDELVYLVHYTGWNTRYDEWIKRARIAQNFTQSQGRQKRTKATPRPQTPNTGSSSQAKSSRTAPNAGTGAASSAQSRRRAVSVAPTGAANKDTRKDDRESTPATRSTTPSPLTPSVLRTKSPASSTGRSTRVTRNADLTTNELGRRTRRASGHADSVRDADESDSEESETLDSDVSTDTRQVQLRATRVRGGAQERNRREARKRAESRMKVEETSDGETEKDAEEPRRGRRVRKPVSKMEEIKSEPDSDEEQPKGRDFDLNQIRSELKGFDKAVKLDIASIEPDQEDDQGNKPLVTVKQEKIEPEAEKKVSPELEKKREAPKQEPQNASPTKRESIKLEAVPSDNTDDIYEFKEPEPFEFEVRNKRDSGGSGGTAEKEKEKDTEKDKDKVKKRVFEEDQKSPKKRQKTVNAVATAPVNKIEPKPESSPLENADNKKKTRKIFKKNEETDDVDTESDDVSTARDPSKFYASNYSNVTVYKRKGGTPVRTVEEADDVPKNASEDKDKAKKIVAEEESKTPKKRQPKTFGPATGAKIIETKAETVPDVDGKKKVRKIFAKKPDDAEEMDNNDASNKETPKFLPSYGATKITPRKDAHETDENSVDKSKKVTEEDSNKNVKKAHKTYRNTPTKAETNAEITDVKRKLVRRLPIKKVGEAEDTDDSAGNEVEEPTITRDHTKYYSYSGPKAKAAAMMNENDSLQDRLVASKPEAQTIKMNESTKVFMMTASPINANKDDVKFKTVESLMSLATTSTASDTKQVLTIAEKKRVSDPGQLAKPEIKQEMKPLDFTPIIPHTLPIPAPISTRLPATANIEEKLSAAAAFRSKAKDTKKDEESETIQRKPLVVKKPDIVTPKKAKEKEEVKVKHEPEKKKQQHQQAPEQSIIIKKDPLQEIEIRKDPLLEVMNKKDEEAAAAAAKVSVIPMVTAVTKTYGTPKKDTTTNKIEESWKKAKILPSASNEQVTCELPNSEPAKEYVPLRKETIVSKIKSSIDRDSIDSTDSSDSERRLTIIDSEDFVDDKNESSSDSKAVKIAGPSVVVGQLNNASQERPNSVASHIESKQSTNAASITSAMIQPKSTKIEEDGENLNSLLCEEEIPGSPTPGAEVSDQEHRSSAPQNILKTDMRSKMAVAFVAAQLPISTLPSSSQMTNCAMVTTMSSGVTVSQSTSSNIVTIPIAVQHSNIQSIRQSQPQQQPMHLQQTHPQLQVTPQIQQHRPLHQHLLQQQHQQQQQQLQQLHQQQQQQQQQPQHHHAQQHPPQRHEHQVSIPVAVQRRESNEAAPVMDNTPPTTPDSTISNMSGSPRDEGTGGSTPSSSEDNSKLNRDSSEAENDSAGKGSGQGLSEDDGSLVSSEIGGNGATSSSDRIPKPPAKRSVNDGENVSPKKRRKRKDQDGLPLSGQNNASGKKSPRQSVRNARHGTGSDSDDTSEGSNQFVNTAIPSNNLSTSSPAVITQAVNNNMSMSGMSSAGSLDLGNFSPSRQAKFNFLIDLDPTLDGNQRISILQNRIAELRKAYLSVKSELSTVERRRKKLKRRKREAQKAAKAEMQQACS